jgi:hypothetical protein
MNMTRYPENITVSLEDFKKCSWLEAIQDAKKESYSSISLALSSCASKATEDERFSEAKVLWLLTDAFSMMLNPSSHNEPFKPFIMWADGRRSSIPEDFKVEDIAFFEEIIDEITEPKLYARIADLLWLCKKPRNQQFALKAIDAYIKTPLTAENGVQDEFECWERSIQLCMMLRNSSRLQEIENQLVASIQNATKEDKFFALKLSNLFAEYIKSDSLLEITEKLEKLGCEFEETSDFYTSREYFSEASKFYTKLGMLEKSVAMTIKVAEGWVKEANTQQSNINAAHNYENAIHTYWKIPKSYRDVHNIDNLIAELRTKLNLANKNSISEMGTISTGEIDISELVENARNTVSNKNAIDALLTLANIYQGAKIQRFKESAEKSIREHPLSNLFSDIHLGKDGRVIAKSPASNLGGAPDEAAVWAKMVQQYSMEINLAVQAKIWAALEIIRLEHRITEVDFYSVVRQSAVIPEGRERLIAKGLFAGYDNDFVTALHILIPQVEHLVRIYLKQAGVKTSTLDKNGIETENGLSTLMDNPEVDTIFGEDLAFEFKALLCDSFGANLRNELAHGLIEYEECYSINSIYAWWLILRIVFNAFLNVKHTSTRKMC